MGKSKKTKKISKEVVDNRLFSRRQFLIGAGHTMLTLPPLLSLMPREVLAQVTGSKVTRYIGMVGILGIDPYQFFPVDQNGLSFVSGQKDIGYKSLSQISGSISNIIDSSFTDLYPYMNLIQGLSMTGGLYQGHNSSIMAGTHSQLRGPNFGRTIDVVLEKSSGVYKSTDVVAKKAVRFHDHDHTKGMSWDAAGGSRIVSQSLQGDWSLFNLLLSNLTGGTVGGGGSTGPTQGQLNKKLVVDQVYTDLKALESNSRISSYDKQILDRYITGITDLQKKVAVNNPVPPPSATCSKPTMALEQNAVGNPYKFPWDAPWGINDINKLYDNYIEILRIAAMCDLSRVFHWANSVWVNSYGKGDSSGLHHDAVGGSDGAAAGQKFGIKKLADLARAFKSTPDPINGGNLLDNSIIIYANELGDWTQGHNVFNMPTLTFGKGGGHINSGYFIDCRQRPLKLVKNNYPGRPYKQFLQAVMASMGVTKAEYSKYGDGSGYGEFIQGVNQFGFNDPNFFAAYASVHNDPLPFFYT
ncbi:MAG: DUF1552 domain-containing protein [Bdellovibrionales bacterium]|nr:DUF1552 domain-containing protein [Bdellovibrionales bacterium]